MYLKILKCALLSESGVSSDNEDDDDEEDGSYLHPSLFASKKCNRLEELMKVLVSLQNKTANLTLEVVKHVFV